MDLKEFYEKKYLREWGFKNLKEFLKSNIYKKWEREIDARIVTAFKWFRKFKCKTLLEVGSGLGKAANFFSQHGFETHALDISKVFIEHARKKYKNVDFFVCNFENQKIKFRNYFDGIYSFEVIEHIFDYDKFFENCRRALKHGGLLIISTPNVLALQNRIKVLLGNDSWFRDKSHLHFFSSEFLEKVAERNGFKVITVKGIGKLSFCKNIAGCILLVAKKVK